MFAEGWFPDPFGRHTERWFSNGLPTAIVRDGTREAADPPAEVRQWTVAELGGSTGPLPQMSSLRPRFTGPLDVHKRNRRIAIVYVLGLAAVVTVIGVFGPANSPAPVVVLSLGLVVASSAWLLVNRQQRLDGGLPYTAIDRSWSPWRALRLGTGNPRYDATRQDVEIPGTSLDANRLRRVHLFCDNRLLASVTTTDSAPEKSYVVNGVDYSVVSVTGPYTEHDGYGEAFDVQIARPWQ